MAGGSVSLLKPLLIFLGAGAGGLLRYYIGWLAQSLWGPTFPFGTLVCNVTGCLLMGFLATAWMGPVLIRDEFRVAVLVGILGGYTTFSSFGRETLTLLQDGEWGRAGAYVLASVLVGLFAVWAGAALATRIYGDGVS